MVIPVRDQTYRCQFLYLIRVIQGQLALLDQLHAGDARDHLGAARDPEDVVHSHGLGPAGADLARRMFEDQLAFLVDGGKDHPGGTRRV